MELGLSLGDAAKPFDFLEKPNKSRILKNINGGLDFCMRLGVGIDEREKAQENDDVSETDGSDNNEQGGETALHLNLAPAPLRISSHLLPWSSDNGSSENGSSGNMKGLDVNKPSVEEASSAKTDLLTYRSKRELKDVAAEAERATSRASDDDENNNRKKLRLSKQQSAFLEESFKEHNILNPKQKVALAKQLNLGARQVEVWFQNRRARTKLKLTEVECEYLKRCCETLTEEKRRLQKEVRALKSWNPLYKQRPATTLTMCPSCERVATTATAKGKGSFPPNFFPFPQTPNLDQLD